MNVSQLFTNKKQPYEINNKIYKIRGVSIKDILKDTERYYTTYEMLAYISTETFEDNEEDNIFINKFLPTVIDCVDNYNIKDEEDLENFKEILFIIVELSMPVKMKDKIGFGQRKENDKEEEKKPLNETPEDHKSRIEDYKIKKMKDEYLKRIEIDDEIYTFVEIVEMLRIRNIRKPEKLTIKQLMIMFELHNKIENNNLFKILDLHVSAISLFKIKNGGSYKQLVTKLKQ